MVAAVSGAMIYHRPALAEEAVEALLTDPHGVYVDATFGGGGHSRLILERLSAKGQLIGIDQDPAAPLHLLTDPRFIPRRANFRHLRALLGEVGIARISGLLADLGVSSYQLDTPERGFSYRVEAPLDLRMNPHTGLPAREWIPLQSEAHLTAILRSYGDLPRAHRLASAILHKRPQTTTELAAIVRAVYGARASAYLAQTFQALRIAINDELHALDDLLTAATDLTYPGGRLVVLTYHSGEARRVKALYQKATYTDLVYGVQRYTWKLIYKTRPSSEEIRENPRSRSAILWVLQKEHL